MKILKSISVLFIFLVLGSGAFAQGNCRVTLTDPNMSSNEPYNVQIILEDWTSGSAVPIHSQNYNNQPWAGGSGTAEPFPFTYQIAKDDQSDYKFHVIVQETSVTPYKYAQGWSIGLFDVTGYYSSVIDVSVSF